MTLQQLRYVTTVAETGTISGAAKALFISQPSLTAAIQELEKEMGITIFLRTNRGVVLSREGDEFLGYARQVLMQAELLEDRYGAQSSHRQQFAVSAQHYNFAARVFARVVRDMGGERYSMTFRETTTYEVIEDVGRMRSEVGVLVMTKRRGAAAAIPGIRVDLYGTGAERRHRVCGQESPLGGPGRGDGGGTGALSLRDL